jgi:polysaccharide biosynthesis/export protein
MTHHPSATIGRLLSIFVAALLALAMSACSSTRSYPPAPASVTSVDRPYLIGPLDVLNITVWRNPELASTVTVRPDGRISFPLLNDVVAAGRSPTELSKEIETGLSRVIQQPQVTIVVGGFSGTFAEQIRIVGEAARPQAVPFRKNMSVLDVMIQAGGLTDYADGNAAVLVRGSEGGKQYSLRLNDLLKRGDISANSAVLPGDIIIVPHSWF